MNFADTLIEQLFSQPVSHYQPLYTEVLERSRAERYHYQDWIREEKFRALGQTFSLAVYLKKHQLITGANVHTYHSAEANAFSLSCYPGLDPKSFRFYFDYLKDTILEMGYNLDLAERSYSDRRHYIETTERYVLKFPETYRIGEQYHPLYGTLLLEMVCIDDKPSYLKVMASYQQDALYAEPLSFEELTTFLLDF